MQQEIAQFADATVRRYNEMTPEDDRTPVELVHAMRSRAQERISKLNVKMSKLVAVANLANKQGFLDEVISYATSDSKSIDAIETWKGNSLCFSFVDQIEKHWSCNEVPKMTLEKLQMVAMCNTTGDYKIKFLE